MLVTAAVTRPTSNGPTPVVQGRAVAVWQPCEGGPRVNLGEGLGGQRRSLSVLMLWAVDGGVAGPADVRPMTVRRRVAVAGHPPDEHLVRPPRVPVRAPLGSLLNHWTEHAFEDRRVDPDLRCGNLLHLAEGSRRGGQRTTPPRDTGAGPFVPVRRSQRPLV